MVKFLVHSVQAVDIYVVDSFHLRRKLSFKNIKVIYQEDTGQSVFPFGGTSELICTSPLLTVVVGCTG